MSDEVADGATNGRGNGLLVDKGDGRSGLQKTFFLVLVGGLLGHGNSGDGGLDHAERGDDFVEHVCHLFMAC
jgi:hypothetical protein